MIVTRTDPSAFTVEFESEDELREEQRSNLSVGGLRIRTSESATPNTALTVALRGPWSEEAVVRATVVALLPDGIAVAVEGDTNDIVERLLTRPAAAVAQPDGAAEESEITSERDQKTSWDRVRGLSQVEKMLLAVKADRTERAVLVQDNDPRVLLSLLRNPRLTVDEVVRLAKSSFINFQIADVIMKAAQWMANVDVRIALIHNPKTPQAFSLRILPTLPEPEVRAIARGGTNMTLKQAALRQLQGRS